MHNCEETLHNIVDLCIKNKVDGYFVSMDDEFFSGDSIPGGNPIRYMSNFTGGNAIIIIAKHRHHCANSQTINGYTAYFFTDGRYTTQAAQEVSPILYTIFDMADLYPFCQQIENITYGIDPKVTASRYYGMLSNENKNNIQHTGSLANEVWEDRPFMTYSPTWIYDDEYAGMSVQEKIALIRNSMPQDISGYFIFDIMATSWLLNIRATDLANSPAVLAYTFLLKHSNSDGIDVILFHYDLESVNCKHANYRFVKVMNMQYMYDVLHSYKNVGYNKANSSVELMSFANTQSWKDLGDLCIYHMATKTNAEIEGARIAHREDAIALCEFLSWINYYYCTPQFSALTECDVAKYVQGMRAESQLYIMNSFDTICGVDTNSAMIHYRPQEHSTKAITQNSLILLDSGGHYFGGTTDVTRTFVLDVCDRKDINEIAQWYTRVLKGHLALANVVFPRGTCGNNLDILARQYLLQYGYDYPHGTGHGVGNALSVHEGPCSIGRGAQKISLQPNMILSNEPGYYNPSTYGIRIENLQYVQPKFEHFLCFETLTLVPYCKKLIDMNSLTSEEIQQLNSYYDRIMNEIHPFISNKAKYWLENECRLDVVFA